MIPTQRDIQAFFQIWRNRLLFKLLTIRRLRRRKKLKRHFQGSFSHEAFPYRYSAGRYTTLFLAGLKEGKLLASRCANCKTTLVHCRQICGNCFRAMSEIVELPGTGQLISYTQVSFPFVDPFTGQNRPVPYCYGMILLDGADNAFQGLLNVRYHHHLKNGLPLRVVFHKKRKGHIGDIKYFKILKTIQ